MAAGSKDIPAPCRLTGTQGAEAKSDANRRSEGVEAPFGKRPRAQRDTWHVADTQPILFKFES